MNPHSFIFIDDDDIHNLISRLTVEAVLGQHIGIQAFTNPKLALEAIQSMKLLHLLNPTNPTIILLDINMPVMSGWEFLELFDCLETEIKKSFRIFILSSSVDQRDRERSYANKNVSDFLLKPLTSEIVLQIIGKE